jgi:drug/metabolite transporter (DMT)-like permease
LLFALLAALLFGASTPASKALLAGLGPLQLAGLLYLGAALATAPLAVRDRARKTRAPIDARNRRRLAGAIVLGGIAGPVLVLFALQRASSSSVALLLNLEMAATAVLGVLCFREHIGRAGWVGIAAGLGAGIVVSQSGGLPGLWAGMLVLGACIAWGFDNHLTALIDGMTPAEAAAWKGAVAGSASLALGIALEPWHAQWLQVLAALGIGTLAYGASIVFYVTSAQHLGATRAQVAFSSAPFLGAALSVAFLGEALQWQHLAAAPLLVLGVALLLLDRHEHEHTHEAVEHVHSHRHDDGHHTHAHAGLPASTRHTHVHAHERTTHRHRHLPDLHHRHAH